VNNATIFLNILLHWKRCQQLANILQQN